jgi:hypothetical protein
VLLESSKVSFSDDEEVVFVLVAPLLDVLDLLLDVGNVLLLVLKLD